jgi:hypothetical protein
MAEVWSPIIDAFFRVQQNLSGVDVTVRYPDGETVELVHAVVSDATSEMVLENGVGIESQHREFFIRRTELPSEPVRDMEIVWGGERYMVLHPGGGKVWEWDDHYHMIYRVRAQSVIGGTFARAAYGTGGGEAYGNADGDAYGTPED